MCAGLIVATKSIYHWTMNWLAWPVAALVFFQWQAPLGWHTLALNLADPFAMIVLLLFAAGFVRGEVTPDLRSRGLKRFLIAFTVVLLLAFLHGAVSIGITNWALVGRLAGWFVLLAYFAAGYLLVGLGGQGGLRRLAIVLGVVAATIVVVTAGMRLASSLDLLGVALPANFEGFSANRNAFALQLLVVLALLLAHAEHDMSASASHREDLCVIGLTAFVLVGLVWSASRAGWLVGGLILGYTLWKRPCSRRVVLAACSLGALTWLGARGLELLGSVAMFWLSGALNTGAEQSIGTALGEAMNQLRNSGVRGALGSPISEPVSNVERLATLRYGAELWLSAPILGSGLGVFHQQSSAWFGHATVIHNTPLWILAEFGLVGLGVVAWTVLSVVREFASGPRDAARRGAELVAIAVVIFSLVHEIFYQRIIWLVLGAVLAIPVPSSETRGVELRRRVQ